MLITESELRKLIRKNLLVETIQIAVALAVAGKWLLAQVVIMMVGIFAIEVFKDYRAEQAGLDKKRLKDISVTLNKPEYLTMLAELIIYAARCDDQDLKSDLDKLEGAGKDFLNTIIEDYTQWDSSEKWEELIVLVSELKFMFMALAAQSTAGGVDEFNELFTKGKLDTTVSRELSTKGIKLVGKAFAALSISLSAKDLYDIDEEINKVKGLVGAYDRVVSKHKELKDTKFTC